MKKTLISIFLFTLLAAFVFASDADEIVEGRQLVDSKISCDKLSDDQLEAIGEYFMEQMHPGEQHELMHQMMGITEDTPEHKQVHVNMARMMYCGQGGMMSMMKGGMMGPGMMGGYGMGPGMMGGAMWGFGSVLWTLIAIGLILVVWLWVVKLWKEVRK